MKNPAVVYLSKWSERSDTRKTMRGALVRVVAALVDEGSDNDVDPEKFPWSELRYEDVRAIAAEMSEDYSPRTINLSLSALRGVLEAAWRSGQLADEVYRMIQITNVSGGGERAGRALSTVEMSAIADVLDRTEPLEAAVVAVLAGGGLRRVELVRLRVHSYDAETKRLSVRGKGNKVRSIPLGARWQPALERWHAQANDLLFDLGENSRRRVSYIVERFWKSNKLLEFTPHDLRRTFLTHVERVGGMALAQQLAGHSNINTTALYVRVDEAREAAAVKDL